MTTGIDVGFKTANEIAQKMVVSADENIWESCFVFHIFALYNEESLKELKESYVTVITEMLVEDFSLEELKAVSKFHFSEVVQKAKRVFCELVQHRSLEEDVNLALVVLRSENEGQKAHSSRSTTKQQLVEKYLEMIHSFGVQLVRAKLADALQQKFDEVELQELIAYQCNQTVQRFHQVNRIGAKKVVFNYLAPVMSKMSQWISTTLPSERGELDASEVKEMLKAAPGMEIQGQKAVRETLRQLAEIDSDGKS